MAPLEKSSGAFSFGVPVAYSFTKYTGNGVSANWTFSFPYLDATDVFTTVNGELFY